MSEADEPIITISEEQTMAANPHLSEKIIPTVGESVPVANGLQGPEPTSCPVAADEPSGYEVQPSTHSQLAPLEAEKRPPSISQDPEFHDESDITPTNGSEELVTETPLQEALTQEAQARESDVLHQSNATSVENPSLSDSPVEERSVYTEAVDDTPHESSPVTAGHDSPTESDPSTEAKDEPIVADIPEDVVVSHIADTPGETSDPVSEIPTNNPFLALEEAPSSDDSAPQDTPSEDKPEVHDSSPDEVPIANEATQEDGKHEESQLGSHILSVKQEEEKPSIENTDIQTEEDLDRDGTNTEAESRSQVEPMAEAEPAKGLQQVFELASEDTPAADVYPVSQRDLVLQESYSTEAAPTEESIVFSKAKDAMETDKAEAPDDGMKAQEDEAPVEKISTADNANFEETEELSTGKFRSIDAEECSNDHQGFPAVAPLTAANGENGIPHGVDQPVEREQDQLQGDEGAKGKENPGFSMKLPLVLTGLAVAVGVAVASMSRSR